MVRIERNTIRVTERNPITILGRDRHTGIRGVVLVENRLRTERDLERLGREWLDTASIVLEDFKLRRDWNETVVRVIDGLRDASVLPRVDRD